MLGVSPNVDKIFPTGPACVDRNVANRSMEIKTDMLFAAIRKSILMNSPMLIRALKFLAPDFGYAEGVQPL